MIRKIAKFVLVSALTFSVATAVVGCATTDKTSVDAFKNVPQEQLFKDGQSALANSQYDDAVKRFESIEAQYPFGVTAEKSQLDIIYAHYKLGDNASALASADRYIRLYPRGKNVDYAYYMKGLINMDRAQSWIQKLAKINPTDRELEPMQEAFNSFNQLVRFFPNSKYNQDARQRMIYIRGLLAQKELDIAKYYLKRKMYVASANRASYVFKHYQGTQQAIEATAVMVHAYRGLGEKEMANDALETLKLNYPKSETYKNLLRA